MDLESIIGQIDDTTGITDEQRLVLGRHMLGQTCTNLSSTLLKRLSTEHWLLGYRTKFYDNHAIALASLVNIWAANALVVTLPEEDVATYTAWRKDNRPAGFAGAKLPDTRLATANTWYEMSYESGKYPTLIPLRDKIDADVIKIKRIAIHAVHAHSAFPFPDAESADTDEAAISKSANFLRDAIVMAYIEDDKGKIHTLAGTVSYGVGGASMWRVDDVQAFTDAIHGQGKPGPLSNLAQFAVGELAYILSYYQHDYDTLREEFTPVEQTEWDSNVEN